MVGKRGEDDATTRRTEQLRDAHQHHQHRTLTSVAAGRRAAPLTQRLRKRAVRLPS